MKLQDLIYKEGQDFSKLLIDKDLNVSKATWFNRFVVWVTIQFRGKRSRYDKLTIAQAIQGEFNTKKPSWEAFENLTTLRNRILKVNPKNYDKIKEAFDKTIENVSEIKYIEILENALFTPEELTAHKKEIEKIKQGSQIQELEQEFLKFIFPHRRAQLKNIAKLQFFSDVTVEYIVNEILGEKRIIRKEEMKELEKSIYSERTEGERTLVDKNKYFIESMQSKYGQRIVKQVEEEFIQEEKFLVIIDRTQFAARCAEIQGSIAVKNKKKLKSYKYYFAEGFIEARIKAFVTEGKNQIELGLIEVPSVEEIVGKIIGALKEKYTLQKQRDANPKDEADKDPINSVLGYIFSIFHIIKGIYKDDFAKKLIAGALRKLGYLRIGEEDIQFEMSSILQLLITKMRLHKTNFQHVKNRLHEELIKLITQMAHEQKNPESA